MQYRCPLCLTNGVVPDKARGNEVLCLQCKEKFFIPDLSLDDRLKLGVFYAARRNDGEVLDAWAEQGKTLDLQEDDSGHTPLHISALYGKLYATKVLLERGASLEVFSYKTQQTPIFYAARENCKKILVWLLEKGANPDAKDPDGTTPLHWATRKGHIEIVKLLVDSGADVKAEDVNGLRPLQYSLSYNQPELRAYLAAAERASKFIQRQRVKSSSKGTLNRFLFGMGNS